MTAREREVARLIGMGLTNRAIASELGISDRTVGAHVQNILNKLGAVNRAQIAAWSAQRGPGQQAMVTREGVTPPSVSVGRWRERGRLFVLIGASLAVSLLLAADHPIQPVPDSVQGYERGVLVYQAHLLAGDGPAWFTARELYGDLNASAVEFGNGFVEYSVLRPGGHTGNAPNVQAMASYFTEVSLAVVPGSNVTFWLNLTSNVFPVTGQHVVAIKTRFETMQMAYYTSHDNNTHAVGPQVSIPALQTGRTFAVAVLVKPPRFEVFLDGSKVIDVTHTPNPTYQIPSLTIFGDGVGTVRLSAFSVFQLD